MIKRISVLLLLLALSMTALFGCSQTKETKHASAIINTDKTNKEENLTPVTLNEVAHSIFYAPMYVAIEKGYFEEEGINLNLVTGFGADKTMTAVISGTADIGFMGSEASIYAYNEGANDYVVNFAQLTQRAGNFLVAREEIPDFHWTDLKDKKVLGGRKGGMPEMVFEYILKQNGLALRKICLLTRVLTLAPLRLLLQEIIQQTLLWSLNPLLLLLKSRVPDMLWHPWVLTPAMCHTPPIAPKPAI